MASFLWLFLGRSNYRAYVSALVKSLGARRFDLSQETAGFHDKAFESHVRQALGSASDEEITYLLGVLPEMEDADWAPEFRGLLQRQNPEVKMAALGYLRENGSACDLRAVLSHIKHQDPQVCATAIYAAVALGGQQAIEAVEPLLLDTRPTVRAAAVANLINSGDLDRLLAAGAALKEMLASQSVGDRIAAADALSHIRNTGLVRPTIGLLQDPDESVRSAALAACRNRPTSQLIPVVVPLLADPAVAADAAETLAEFGPDTLDHLIPYIELSQMEGAFSGAFHVPAILAKIGDISAMPVLLRATEHPDLRLRSEAVKAYAQMVQDAPSIRPHLADVYAAIERQVSAGRACAQVVGDADTVDAVILQVRLGG